MLVMSWLVSFFSGAPQSPSWLINISVHIPAHLGFFIRCLCSVFHCMPQKTRISAVLLCWTSESMLSRSLPVVYSNVCNPTTPPLCLIASTCPSWHIPDLMCHLATSYKPKHPWLLHRAEVWVCALKISPSFSHKETVYLLMTREKW